MKGDEGVERGAWPMACAVCDICGAPTLDFVTEGEADGCPIDVCAFCREERP